MKFEIQRLDDTGKIVFSGEVEKAEIERLRLSRADRALLLGAASSNAPADHLLLLEMLYRRHAEQTPPCECVDCDGGRPGHDPHCPWMNDIQGVLDAGDDRG